jgi:hypothetical protein
MRRGIVQKIFNDHFAEYEKQNKLHARELYAAWSIQTCRTHEQGYHINACPNGDYSATFYNSCKHRSCPQCGATDTERWLERQNAQALDCPYFHIVFTISHALHIIWRFNRRLFTGLMMRAAWRSLRELVLDWKYLGGLPGAVAVFQSWDDDMREHCHLHFIVTAGGLTDDGRWVGANEEFLLPTPVLAAKFRGKFLAYLRKALCRRTSKGVEKEKSKILRLPYNMSKQKCLNLINKLGRKRWHADIEPAYAHPKGALKYVGRYIRRGPISERRIIGYNGKTVTIGYTHEEKHDKSSFTLTAPQFIARLLAHVPEKGTHVVRNYGLFHPRCREKLNMARKHLGQVPYVPSIEVPDAIEILIKMFPDQNIGQCPVCRQRLRTVFIYRGGRAPIWQLAA